MQKSILLLLTVTLFGFGCFDVGIRSSQPLARPIPTGLFPDQTPVPEIVLPIDETIVKYEVIFKGFGEYIQDRFTGYHVGEDIEVPEVREAPEVPVRSIADGTVRFVDWVSGYGGLVVIQHAIDDKIINSLYGHLDVSSIKIKVGDAVSVGQTFGRLGEGKTEETDGERQHLHFALYEGDELRKNGYEKNAEDVKKWMNPTDFFLAHVIPLFKSEGMHWMPRSFSELVIPAEAREQFSIDFQIPDYWDAEYIPSLKAINLYDRAGQGSARERSQMFIRYFDASEFLTLPSVTIHDTKDLFVGKNQYTARRYEIEKKPAVADFFDQPSWRNERHIVTDFRGQEGKTRYYVVAGNPALDIAVYEEALQSMEILFND